MSLHNQMLDRRESALHEHLIEQFDMVDQAVKRALTSLEEHDVDLARSVISNDGNINSKHQQVENECVLIIARNQPVARDLRELLSDMHISAELERIADYASSIAAIVTEMKQTPDSEVRDGVIAMGRQCRDMLSEIRDAYDRHDVELANAVARMDDNIDEYEQGLIRQVFDHQNDHPQNYQSSTRLLWITHNLERIGDRITNIAERIIFIVTGQTAHLN